MTIWRRGQIYIMYCAVIRPAMMRTIMIINKISMLRLRRLTSTWRCSFRSSFGSSGFFITVSPYGDWEQAKVCDHRNTARTPTSISKMSTTNPTPMRCQYGRTTSDALARRRAICALYVSGGLLSSSMCSPPALSFSSFFRGCLALQSGSYASVIRDCTADIPLPVASVAWHYRHERFDLSCCLSISA
jgi:hypothetical protein